MPKSQRKKYSQFFTSKETAIFMAELFDILDKKALRRDGALTPTGEQFLISGYLDFWTFCLQR